MAIKNKITLQPIPQVDASSTYSVDATLPREADIPAPEGAGWSLAYSFKGELNVYHVWQQGTTRYDSGMENYWTSRCDDIPNNRVGEGPSLVITTESGTANSEVMAEFIPWQTYLYGGNISWEGASPLDSVSIYAIATGTPVSPGGLNNLIIDGDDKIIPVDDGAGTHELAGNPTVVDNKSGSGAWNFAGGALVEAPNLDGNVDLYTVDKTVAKLVNHIPTIPSVSPNNTITSENAWKILPGYKFKIIAHNVSDSVWSVGVTFFMIRRKTAEY